MHCRKKSHQHGIGLIGDLPIFIAHDSADVWSHQELFQLDRLGQPSRVSGYPPDRFKPVDSAGVIRNMNGRDIRKLISTGGFSGLPDV